MMKSILADTTKTDDASIIAFFSVLGIAALGIFGTLHVAVEHNPVLGYLELLGSLGILFNLGMLWVTKNIALAHNLFLLLVIVMLMVMLITGGTQGTGIFWFFIFPPAAFFLTGKLRGILWMGLLYLLTAGTMVLADIQNVPLPYSDVTIRQLLAVLFVVIIGTYIYQHSREKAESGKRESQEDLQEYLDNMTTLHIKVAPDKKILFANHAAKTALGLGEKLIGADFIGGRWWQFDPGVRERLQTAFQTVLGGKNVDFDTRIQTASTKSTPILPIKLSMQPITRKGRIKYILVEARDISLELEVEHAKSEFVTLASHQLRTPMSAIQWYSEMLLSGDTGKLSSEQRGHVQEIYTSNLRLKAIVDAMLMVSTLELGHLPIRPEPTDITEVSKQVLADELHNQPNVKDLQITEDYAAHLPRIPLDPLAIKTILRNVLSNAIKYTPPGGGITITIKRSDEKLSPSSTGSVMIAVKDTGYGIPIHEQKNIFVKLFRAGNIKEKDTDGTGLGLYIIKELIEQVGGRISFVSRQGKGSTFTILLPIEGMQASDATTNKPSKHGVEK